MKAPLGVLDNAKAVDLSVFEASKATCTEATGHVSAIPPEEDGTQTFELTNKDCLGGAAWCKVIELDKGEIDMMFAVLARNESGVIAEGCAVRKIDQDPLELTIKMHLANAELCCNDGFVQAGEQCEGTPAGGTCGGIVENEVCDSGCLAKEIQLANVSLDEPILPEGGRLKTELAMAFCPGTDQLSGGLRAVFSSASSDATQGRDVNFRALTKDLNALTDPFPFSHQLRLPMECETVGGTGGLKEQRSPAIAPVSDSRVGIVYLSNETAVTRNEVFLIQHTLLGCADVKAIKLSTAMDVPDGAERPDFAGGPSGFGLAVWVRGGEAYGRIWEAPTDAVSAGNLTPLDPNLELALTPAALDGTVTSVRVAGTPTGWVIVYSAGGDGDADGGIFMDTVDTKGALGGAPLRVNDVTMGVQDQPDVATLKDGTRLVAWRNKKHIYFQRYLEDTRVGDQFNDLENPMSSIEGEQANPAVGAPTELGGFFVVAWEEVLTTDIGARIVDAKSGFLPNSVTGQPDVFLASHPGFAGVRKLPAVAIGGHVVIGWQDENPSHEGVFVRRFPLPGLP
jgi:hypothetical protein